MLIWFVIIYWVVSVGIGLWAALRVKNTADFAAAGHSLPLPIVTATVFATWFGSETVLGIPATFLKDGFGGIVADPFGSSLCLILVGLFFARHLYNRRMLTIGDFFREKYGRTVEVLVTLCIVISLLSISTGFPQFFGFQYPLLSFIISIPFDAMVGDMGG